MSDISIGGNFHSEHSPSNKESSDFLRLKSEYERFMASSKSSDLANSPVLMADQMDMLNQLEELAKKEQRTDELEYINTQKEELKERLNAFKDAFKDALPSNIYYHPVHYKGKSNQGNSEPSTSTIQENASDQKNSIVSMAEQMDDLRHLKELAIQENRADDIKDIDNQIEELARKINAFKSQLPSEIYHDYVIEEPAVSSVQEEDNVQSGEQNSSQGTALSDKKYYAGDIEALFDKEDNDYHVSNLIKQCTQDGEITQNTYDAVSILAAAGITPNIVSQILDNISVGDENQPVSGEAVDNPDAQEGTSETQSFLNFDLEVCRNIADLNQRLCKGKKLLDDSCVLTFSKLFNQNFEDMELLKQSLVKMTEADISADTIVKLIDTLAVSAGDTDKKRISENAVKSVITIKRTFDSTKNNEKAERENPINQLGVLTLSLGNKDFLILKKDKVIHVSPTEGKTVQSAKKEYDELIKKVEENLLINIARDYKTDEGEIPTNYLRLISALRRSGIAYSQVQEMTNFCMDSKGEIDTDKLSAVTSLKKSGALGAEVPGILSSCQKDSAGKISKSDLKNACDLSSAVISGQEVSSLLEHVRDNEDKKEFFMYISPFFEDKSYLLSIAELINDPDNESSLRKIEILYNLAQNFLGDTRNPMSEGGFIKNVEEILKTAQNSGETTVEDEAAGICAVMCKNRMSPEEIKVGLDVCKNNEGVIDEDLAEMLWNMCLQNADIGEITDAIANCKDPDGNINREETKFFLSES